jgi:hypothetical protein
MAVESMDVRIEKTRNTPYFGISEGLIEIKGRSIPEDSFEFFEPIVDTIKQYLDSSNDPVTFNIHLDYVNSGSKKYLTNILKILEDYTGRGIEVNINWLFDKDDESIMELGQDLASLLQLQFHFTEVE